MPPGPLDNPGKRPDWVPRSPLRWRFTRGPWYDNNLAVVELQERNLHFWWSRGEVVDGDVERPALHRVATVDVATPVAAPA